MTVADELRAAAKTIRDNAGNLGVADLFPPTTVALIADVLDEAAHEYSRHGNEFQTFVAGDEGGDLDSAVALARAINGSAT